MADLQTQFEQFNKTICLGRFEEEQTLRDKRDIVRKKIEDYLPAVFEKYGETCPEFYFRNQGSYELGTGIKPLNGDYDIDQGLYFICSKEDYPDPVTLKKRVHEALDGHTKDVRIRRPCVTVFYQKNGEYVYHVDIAIYSAGNANGKTYLATGRLNSLPINREWLADDPATLAKLLSERFSGNDRKQFRRILRYLKRWKDFNFSKAGFAAPRGIALSVAAYYWFSPVYTDRFSGKMNDLGALKSLVKAMIDNFQTISWVDSIRRLTVNLPVEPNNDLFAKMTDVQMKTFEQNLTDLYDLLVKAEQDADPVTGSQSLQNKAFGADFPVPAKTQTAQRSATTGIVGVHESA
ncbi:nucleotidyltransferase domain-containing protein [Spirosoma fluminis]